MKYIYLIVAFALLFTACNPVTTATTTTVSAPKTKTDSQSTTATLEIPISAITPTFTTEILPTLTPAPTSTAIATLEPGQPLTLANLHMMDELNGWGVDVGEHIVHTTDGGHTWKDVTPRNGAYQEGGFFALDTQTAWATPYQWDPIWNKCYRPDCPPDPNVASIWHTTNAGETWTVSSLCLVSCEYPAPTIELTPYYYHPIGIQFLDSNIGWLAVVVSDEYFHQGYILYRTRDGGGHWEKMISSVSGPALFDVAGFAFQNEQIGWLAATSFWDGTPAADWRIYQTIDSGRTWMELALPQPAVVPEIFNQHTTWCGVRKLQLIPPTGVDLIVSCFVYVGDYPPIFDYHYHSANRGQSWVSWLETDQAARWDNWHPTVHAEFLTPEIGWRIIPEEDNAYGLETTTDGGISWFKIKTVYWSGDLEFLNVEIGWGVVKADKKVALVHTIDGGKTWEELKPIVSP